MTRSRRFSHPFQAVNTRDARMIQRGEELRFALEPCQPIDVSGDVLRKYRDGDVATEGGVVSLIDLAHAAHPDETADLVVSKTDASREAHKRGRSPL